MYGIPIQVPLPYGGFNLEAMDAHGGWVASATDLLRFLLAVDGYDSRPDILAPTTLKRMVTPTDALQSGYALGWWVNNQDDWCHTGSLPGSSALLERTGNGFSWVVLFNRRSEAKTYFGELYRLIGKGIKQVRQWPEYDLFQVPGNIQSFQVAPPDTAFRTRLLPDPTLR
jgi:hypothetical protein